ncbi:hypothetical protein BCV69DRAFT_301385 [Microstroma glucosiphilum]|uniref:Uncharacterized protein n=1 Tax=Pseudomicrostroma glucosiphilum TaxID=1684307 RepID=A0A316TY71_9BASI|nr:hypothetical protein BCV69DRAFT_301385 [Pseudomicrostroma glucosiphilum]PWN18246.1 hypothetical protein BCV69DRAFT_301385 [Pseudomicrostroma glucosiphilum]
MAPRPRNRLPVWDDAASSNGSAAPSTTRSAPSSQATGAHSSRQALLKSSALFLQEVQTHWPAVPTVDIDRPSIHTLGSPGRVTDGNFTRNVPKVRSASSTSASRSHSSGLAPQDALPNPRGAPMGSVSSGQLATAHSHPQSKSTSDNKRYENKNRLSVASSFIHRDSEALEELLLEHETVAHGVRQQSSHESLRSSYVASKPQDQGEERKIKEELPTTQVLTYQAEAASQGQPDASLASSTAKRPHAASPAHVETIKQSHGNRRASQRHASASAPSSNGRTRLSPICSVQNGSSPPDSCAPQVEDLPLVPLVPPLLAAELPSQADLTAVSPLERFAILAGLFSTIVKGSQTSVQQFGNKTVRLKRELRARLEELKRHESKSRQIDLSLQKLAEKLAEVRKDTDTRSIGSSKSHRFLSGVLRRAAASEANLAIKGKEAQWSDDPGAKQYSERIRLTRRELKDVETEKAAVEGEMLHQKSRIRMIEGLLPSLETQVEMARKRFAALRELENTLRSMRLSLNLHKATEEEEDECLAALSSALTKQSAAVEVLKKHESKYEKIVQCEDYLNVAIVAAERLSAVLSKVSARANEANGCSNSSKKGKGAKAKRSEAEDCKEIARLRAAWVGAWQCVYSSLTSIRGNTSSVLAEGQSATATEIDSLARCASPPLRRPASANTVTWASMPKIERKTTGGILMTSGQVSLPTSNGSDSSSGGSSPSSPIDDKRASFVTAPRRLHSTSSVTSFATFRTAQSSNGGSKSDRERVQEGQEVLCSSQLLAALGQIALLLTTLGPLVPPRVLATPLMLSPLTLAQHTASLIALIQGLEKLRWTWDDIISSYEEAGEQLAKDLVERMGKSDERKSEWWSREGERAVSGLAM